MSTTDLVYEKVSERLSKIEQKYLRKYARNKKLAKQIFEDVRTEVLLQPHADASLNEEPWDLAKAGWESIYRAAEKRKNTKRYSAKLRAYIKKQMDNAILSFKKEWNK